MISGVQGEKVGGGVIQNKQRTEHTRHYKDIRCVSYDQGWKKCLAASPLQALIPKNVYSY